MNQIVVQDKPWIANVAAWTPKSVLARMVFADARDDMSAHVLQDFLDAGFREIEWQYGFEQWQNTKLWREMGSVCPVCFALDGQRFKVKWLLENMHHSAPKYSISHVNCECRLVRIARQEEMLDYGEEMDVAPSDIDDALKVGPVVLDDIPYDDRDEFGLPGEINEWTDGNWMWDGERGEFVPWSSFLDSPSDQEWFFDAGSGQFVSREQWAKKHGRQ